MVVNNTSIGYRCAHPWFRVTTVLRIWMVHLWFKATIVLKDMDGPSILLTSDIDSHFVNG